MSNTKFIVNNYKGNTVICTHEQWDNHIVKNHKIMENNAPAVKDTVKDPDTVYKSKENTDREVYFKKTPLSSYPLITKVVVAYSPGKKHPENIVGEVVTAFPQKSEKGGIGDVVYERLPD